MSYYDFFVAPVPNTRRAEYEAFQRKMDALFKSSGATRVVECWENGVPDGKLTSFPLAVKREAGEAVTLGFIEWPSKQTRDQAWEKLHNDPQLQPDKNPMPFDGKRMIYGGFDKIMEV